MKKCSKTFLCDKCNNKYTFEIVLEDDKLHVLRTLDKKLAKLKCPKCYGVEIDKQWDDIEKHFMEA